MAVSSGWGDKKATTWVKCSYWGKGGEGAHPYLKKGQQVAVTGEATLRTYDKDDGTKGFSMELRVNDLTLIGGKADKPAQADSGGFRDKPAPSAEFEEDIPF